MAIRRSTTRGTASSGRAAAPLEPLPVLLLRRGPVSMRLLRALHEERRLELFVADRLTPDWISFARRVAGVFVASEGDPLSALGYAITAGISTPLIVLTPRRFRHDLKDLMDAGAAKVITMPVRTSDIDDVIPLLQTGASARIDTTLRLLLDPITRTARYRNKSVKLSPRSFAVLHCLSEARGRPVSAEELLTYVWGESPRSEKTRQILEVYIFKVRAKLAQLGLRGAISTVRGYGYALVQVAGELR